MPRHSVVKLNKGREKRLREGHLWVYFSDISTINGAPEPGDIVDVISHNGHFLGRGYINENSQITVRLLTRNDENIDRDFFTKRIIDSLEYRRRLFQGAGSYRLVYGEGDFLPGLVVDKYEDTLVVQILTLGIDAKRNLIVDILKETMNPKCIYERSDVSVRRLEGLEERTGSLYGGGDYRFRILENGISFLVDIAEGQKTGYFLDQKENRKALESIVRPGDKVLDVFCHNGTFAIHAAKYGAKSVKAVDISDLALEVAQDNAAINGFGGICEFVQGNAFDLLRQMEKAEEYDIVILDPPAFTKNRGTIEAAVRGYKEINIRGCRLTAPGGFLVTCSCSHHMSKELFLDTVVRAGRDSGKQLRLVEMRTQAKDHPILMGLPETEYLKCAIFQVI